MSDDGSHNAGDNSNGVPASPSRPSKLGRHRPGICQRHSLAAASAIPFRLSTFRQPSLHQTGVRAGPAATAAEIPVAAAGMEIPVAAAGAARTSQNGTRLSS